MERVGVCMLCVGDRDQCECGVDDSLNVTMLSETLWVVGLTEAVKGRYFCEKKTMNLCACDSEQRERGVGAGVNATMLSETL